MTDCKNLDLAREWAADINADRETLSQDTINAAADLISSLPDEWVSVDTLREFISEWRTDCPAGDGPMILEQLESLLPASESAAPRPEDVPEGETWLVRPYENADPVPAFRVHASKYGPGRRWAYFRVGGSMIGFADDEDVTLIARLVPETTKQDDGTAFDPAYTYRDRDGDEWQHILGAWRWLDTAGDINGNYDTPPAKHGPYTRIEA